MRHDPALVALHVVERLRRPAGELRANVLRLVVVAGFYAVHLVNVVFLDLPPGPSMHHRGVRIGLFDVGATLSAGAWAALASAVLLVGRDPANTRLGLVSTAVDLFLLSVLVVLAGGPATPLVLAYPLVVVGSGMRGTRGHVAATTFGALTSFLVIWAGTWLVTDAAPPATTMLVDVAAIAGAGLLTGQLVEATSSALERHRDVLTRLWTTGAGVELPTGAVELAVPSGDRPDCPWCASAVEGTPDRCPVCDQPLAPGIPFREGPGAGVDRVFRPGWFLSALLVGGVFAMLAVWFALRLPAALPPLLLVGGLVGVALVRTMQESVRTSRGDLALGPLVGTLGPAAGTLLGTLAIGAGFVALAVIAAYLLLIVAAVLLFALCVVMAATGGKI